MQRRRFVTMAGAGISFSLAGCSRLIASEESAPDRMAKAEIIETKFIENPAEETPDYILRTQIKSTGEVPIDIIVVHAKFYNKAGSMIGKGYYGVAGLKPGQIFEYQWYHNTRDTEDPPVKASIELSELSPGCANCTPPPGVKFSNEDFKPGTDAAISAHITNTFDTEFGGLISVKFFSKQKHVLDTLVRGIELDPGETKKFTIEGSSVYPEYERKATDYNLYIDCTC